MEEQFFSPRAQERPSSDEPEKTPSLPVSNEELATRRDGCSPLVQRILDDADAAASNQLKERSIEARSLAEAAVNSIDNFFTVVFMRHGGAVGDANGSFLDMAAFQKVVVVCRFVCAVPNAHSKTRLLIFVIACSLVLRQLFVDSLTALDARTAKVAKDLTSALGVVVQEATASRGEACGQSIVLSRNKEYNYVSVQRLKLRIQFLGE